MSEGLRVGTASGRAVASADGVGNGPLAATGSAAIVPAPVEAAGAEASDTLSRSPRNPLERSDRPARQDRVPQPHGAGQPSPASRRSRGSSQRIHAREMSVCNGISPWLAPLAMLLTQDLALPAYFGRIRVQGRENLPGEGPVLLAPTHRARWDALLLPLVAGERISGRHCRFMVTRDEMQGLQGWFLHRLGCFPIDQGRPTLASLRLAVNLLERGEQLVVFPEGRIHRQDGPLRLQQGLARLAQLALGQGVKVQVVPVGIAYARPLPLPGEGAAVQIGAPLAPVGEGREAARLFTEELAAAMASAERSARALVGRPLA